MTTEERRRCEATLATGNEAQRLIAECRLTLDEILNGYDPDDGPGLDFEERPKLTLVSDRRAA